MTWQDIEMYICHVKKPFTAFLLCNKWTLDSSSSISNKLWRKNAKNNKRKISQSHIPCSLCITGWSDEMEEVIPICCVIFKRLFCFQFFRVNVNDLWKHFLGPRGPLKVLSFAHLSVCPQEKSKSPLKPYSSSQDHVRPLIWNIAVMRTMSSII